MSVPTDSAAPLPIATSDPAVLAGETSVVRLGKRVRDWIAALSPAGATAYDTGWVDITPQEGFTATNARVRRIGKEVFYSGTLLGTLAANVTTEIGTVPVGYRPPSNDGRAITAGATTGGASVHYMVVESGGAIRVRVGTAATHNIALGALGYAVD